MTLCFYPAKMPCLPKKIKRRSGMQTSHPPASAPLRGQHLFLIPGSQRRAPAPPPPPPRDLRRQAARVIAITVRHWWA